MIWESAPWKKQLLSTCMRIARWRVQRRLTESSLVSIERELFLGFYAIRKLLDAQTKISFECRDASVPALRFAARAKKADLMNWHKLDELYDFDNAKPTQFSPRDLCNAMIHSFVFTIKADHEGFRGIYFNTDREKNEHLWFIKAEKLQKLFERVENDDVVHLEMQRNSDGDFEILKCSSKTSPMVLKQLQYDCR